MIEPVESNFKPDELRCKCSHCRKQVPNQCNPSSLARLQRVRDRFFAITKRGLSLSSAYRCLKHPDEQAKVKRYGKDYKGGTHVRGTGYDVRIGWGWERQLLIKIAMEEGFLGFGYADSFLHLDDDAKRNDKMTSWTY